MERNVGKSKELIAQKDVIDEDNNLGLVGSSACAGFCGMVFFVMGIAQTRIGI